MQENVLSNCYRESIVELQQERADDDLHLIICSNPLGPWQHAGVMGILRGQDIIKKEVSEEMKWRKSRDMKERSCGRAPG